MKNALLFLTISFLMLFYTQIANGEEIGQSNSYIYLEKEGKTVKIEYSFNAGNYCEVLGIMPIINEVVLAFKEKGYKNITNKEPDSLSIITFVEYKETKLEFWDYLPTRYFKITSAYYPKGKKKHEYVEFSHLEDRDEKGGYEKTLKAIIDMNLKIIEDLKIEEIDPM